MALRSDFEVTDVSKGEHGDTINVTVEKKYQVSYKCPYCNEWTGSIDEKLSALGTADKGYYDEMSRYHSFDIAAVTQSATELACNDLQNQVKMFKWQLANAGSNLNGILQKKLKCTKCSKPAVGKPLYLSDARSRFRWLLFTALLMLIGGIAWFSVVLGKNGGAVSADSGLLGVVIGASLAGIGGLILIFSSLGYSVRKKKAQGMHNIRWIEARYTGFEEPLCANDVERFENIMAKADEGERQILMQLSDKEKKEYINMPRADRPAWLEKRKIS